MKKNFFYALMSAIALTSAIGFTACSSDSDAVVENNPTYDGNNVRTDFAFNITKASQGTRMTAGNVQENSGASDYIFRGMQDMYLYAMKTESPTTSPNGEDALQTYALQSIAQSQISNPTSSKVYPLSIPVGTNNFLFYARALKNSETNFQIGKVTFNNLNAASTKTSNISFSLAPIEQPTGVATPRATTEENFAAYLNDIAASKDASNNTWEGTVAKAATDQRYSTLAKLYTDFTQPVAGEVRAGSAEAIKRMVVDLYNSMKQIVEQASNNNQIPTEISGIATAVCTAINAQFFDLTAPAQTGDSYTIAWKSGVAASAQTYPASYDLPMGAAQLGWNSTDKKIEYVDFDYYNPAINTTGFSAVAVDKITYPAELLYFDNSPLLSTDKYKTVSDYPTTTQNWDKNPGAGEGSFSADWTGNVVKSTTRAVAMRNNVNYGVAMLESTVKVKDGVTALQDNRTGLLPNTTEGNQSFSISDLTGENGIELTGVLIGGQPGSVNWKMLPIIDETHGYDYVIYDKDLASGNSENWKIQNANTTLSKVYTVCFDNYTTATDQNSVCVALQFVNKLGTDFYGAKGLIPAGSTFYLVGKLEPNNATDTWADSYGSSYRISEVGTKRVFGQDHRTIANFSIGATSLQNAYSTIPDLRSTEVLFGLSVDLKWVSGLTFNIDL